jgi:hypothetical protein
MTNTKAPDGAQVPVTTTESPTLPVVQPSVDKQRSSGGISADERATLKAELAEELKREFNEAKSTRDRRMDKIQADIDRAFKFSGMYKDNPEEAKYHAKVDAFMEDAEKNNSSSVDLGKVKKEKGLGERALETLVNAGIVDPTEQEEVRHEWAKKAPPGGFVTEESALAGIAVHMAEFLVAKSKRQAPASAAAAIAPSGGVQVPMDKEKIGGRLLELQKGNLNDPANMAERKALLAELAKSN